MSLSDFVSASVKPPPVCDVATFVAEVQDALEFFTGKPMHFEDPGPADRPLSPGHYSPRDVAALMRHVFARFGNPQAVKVLVSVDYAGRGTIDFSDAFTGAAISSIETLFRIVTGEHDFSELRYGPSPRCARCGMSELAVQASLMKCEPLKTRRLAE